MSRGAMYSPALVTDKRPMERPFRNHNPGTRFALGAGQLGLSLAAEVVGVAAGLHRVVRGQTPAGAVLSGGGPADPVYSLVRDGFMVPANLAGRLGRRLPESEPDPKWLNVQAALNGVFGDTLAGQENPLRFSMQLSGDPPSPQQPLLLFLHGLCLHEQSWRRTEHERFAAQARNEGDFRVARLRYNSGLSIADNGARLAELLEATECSRLVLVGHSMGGLVARSALHQAREARMQWPQRLTHLAALGSPHHGAVAERLGNHANRLLTVTRWSFPFTRLGNLRSAGIHDLRFGNLLPGDREKAGDRLHTHDPRTPVPVPDDIAHLYMAATRSGEAPPKRGLKSDLLVTPHSALAEEYPGTEQVTRELLYHHDHFGLMWNRPVYERLHQWLAAD